MTLHFDSLPRTIGLTTIKAELYRLAHNCQGRRAVLRLDRLDDALLTDIGVKRTDIVWALSLPLSVNSEEALHDRVRRANRRR